MSLPEPYYSADGITVYCGDCRGMLPEMPVADLLLTDPPYGIRYVASARGRVAGRLEGERVRGDDEPFDPRPLLGLAKRAVIFGANHFAHLLPPGGWIIWSKVQDNRWCSGGFSARSLAEVAWTNAHRHVELYNCFWAGSPVHRQTERGLQFHPTQKPAELMSWIVGRTSQPSDLVLDPYMGSGPVAVACQLQGRRYIGIEIEERYCEIAVQRLAQGALPLEATP